LGIFYAQEKRLGWLIPPSLSLEKVVAPSLDRDADFFEIEIASVQLEEL
jgi:hypothetical protein